MPTATGVPPALRTLYNIGPDATARADVASAVDLEQALELQLRRPCGAVVATESIAVIDTLYLLSLANSDLCKQESFDGNEDAQSEVLLEPWSTDGDEVDQQSFSMEEMEFPRYQIQIQLVDHDALP